MSPEPARTRSDRTTTGTSGARSGQELSRASSEVVHRISGLPAAGRHRRGFRYEQVMGLVGRLIEEGGLGRGDRLPTNNELATMAGVSLISVRRALAELEREGRIRRHQGLGTFVASDPIVTDPLKVGDLRATLVEAEPLMRVRSELLRAEQALPGDLIAHALLIAPSDRVWHVERRRYVGTSATIFEEAVVPVGLVPRLDTDALRAGTSLYRLLAEHHGLLDAGEMQQLGFAAATTSERRLLSLPPRAYVARLRGVSTTASGVPFDCFQHVYPAHEFVFSMSSSSRQDRLSLRPDADWSVRPLPRTQQ